MNENSTCIRGLILDMDGVLWRAKEPIGDLPKIFDEISRRKWQVIMATNNAAQSAEGHWQKLVSFGVKVESWQVINSGQVAAHYLKQRHPDGGPVYVVGEEGLVQALSLAGFMPGEVNPLAVVVGLDRQLTYAKLRTATSLIRAGAPFIATNPDRTFPTPEGLVPGAGAVVAAVQAASNVDPVIMGKPFPEMYRTAIELMGIQPAETLVVGDRLDTDIAGGQKLGCPTGLVLSGVTSAEEASRWTPPPTYIASDLEALIKMVPRDL